MKKLTLLCIAFFLISFAKAQSGYQVGDMASNFILKNVDGAMFGLNSFKNAKGYIVVFTCNTCPVSKAYEDRIEALNKQYATKGFPVVAINTNDPVTSPGDSFEKMQERAAAKKFSFPYLEDPDHIYTKAFGAQRTPHVFVLEKTNKGDQVAYIGAIDNDQEEKNDQRSNYVQNAVNQILMNQKPDVSFTKAVGCSIKWKK